MNEWQSVPFWKHEVSRLLLVTVLTLYNKLSNRWLLGRVQLDISCTRSVRSFRRNSISPRAEVLFCLRYIYHKPDEMNMTGTTALLLSLT